mmetsp:Transcript_14699/g.46232  ORF Transcript_14699/g.46232 Transcript_14699/m.46232 type:complete len:374 (-) Transcript_14699:369-1490(-)
MLFGCRCCTTVEEEPVSVDNTPALPRSVTRKIKESNTGDLALGEGEQSGRNEPVLLVSIVGAKGLRDADWLPGSGKSDAYCVLRIHGQEVFRTQVIADSVEPLWKEQVYVWEWTDSDKGLDFEVYDEDLVSSDTLGQVFLPASDFMEKGFNNDVKLNDAGRGEAFLRLRIKLPGVDLPPGPPMEVAMEVPRKPYDIWGLDLDTQDSDSLFVTEVKPGPFLAYNETVGHEEQLRKCDHIVSVNETRGSPVALLNEFKISKQVKVKVIRSCQVLIRLAKAKAEKRPLGLTLPKKPSGFHLSVLGIEEDSVADSHNRCAKNEDQKFRVGDHIIAVDGAQGKASDLLQMLETATGKLRVLVERPVREENAKLWEVDD